jgi:phage-related protein
MVFWTGTLLVHRTSWQHKGLPCSKEGAIMVDENQKPRTVPTADLGLWCILKGHKHDTMAKEHSG